MATVLLVDALPLIYAVHNTPVGKFCTVEGELTGVRFGVLRALRSYQEQSGADKVVVCYDTPEPVRKAEGVEEYKANRTTTDDKRLMYAQIPGLKELLKLTRFTQVEAPGYEADDVIGHLTRYLVKKGNQVLICSPDADLAQLTAYPGTRIWVPKKPKEGRPRALSLGKDWAEELFGVPANGILTIRSVAGDSSDNLAGVSMGDEHKEELAKAITTVGQRYPQVPCMDETHFGEVIDEVSFDLGGVAEFVLRNMKVMKLVSVHGLRITKGERDLETLRDTLTRLEMRSLVKKAEDFT